MNGIKAFAIDIDGTITEDGCGRVYLDGLAATRCLEDMGLRVIYVTGRSSIEAFVLAIFGGTTPLSIGENGGVITTAPDNHILLARKENCLKGYDVLKQNIEGVRMKPVFSRLTEVVLARSFDLREGIKIFVENGLNLTLSDSKYAYHINEQGVDKGSGLLKALKMLNLNAQEIAAIGDSETDLPLFEICGCSVALNHADSSVKAKAKHVVDGKAGKGLVDAIDLVMFNYFGMSS